VPRLTLDKPPTDTNSEAVSVYKNLVMKCDKELRAAGGVSPRQAIAGRSSAASPRRGEASMMTDLAAWESELADILANGAQPSPAKSERIKAEQPSLTLASPRRWRPFGGSKTPRRSGDSAVSPAPSNFTLCGGRTPTMSDDEDDTARTPRGPTPPRSPRVWGRRDKVTPPASPRKSSGGGFVSALSNKLNAAFTLLSPRRTPSSSPRATPPGLSPLTSPRYGGSGSKRNLATVSPRPPSRSPSDADEINKLAAESTLLSGATVVRRTSQASVGREYRPKMDDNDAEDDALEMMIGHSPLPAVVLPSRPVASDAAAADAVASTELSSPRRRTPRVSESLRGVGANLDVINGDLAQAAACVEEVDAGRSISDKSTRSTGEDSQRGAFDLLEGEGDSVAIDDGSDCERHQSGDGAWHENDTTAEDISMIWDDCVAAAAASVPSSPSPSPSKAIDSSGKARSHLQQHDATNSGLTSSPAHLIRRIGLQRGEAPGVRLCLQLPGSPSSPATPGSVRTPISASVRYSASGYRLAECSIDSADANSVTSLDEASLEGAFVRRRFAPVDSCVLLAHAAVLTDWPGMRSESRRRQSDQESVPKGLGRGARGRHNERHGRVRFPVSLAGIGTELLRAAGWWLSVPDSDAPLGPEADVGREVLFSWTLVQLHTGGSLCSPHFAETVVPGLLHRLPHLLLASGFAAAVRDSVLTAALAQWRSRLQAGSSRGDGFIGAAIHSDTPLHRFPIVIPAGMLPSGPLSPVSPAVLARWRSRSGRAEDPLGAPLSRTPSNMSIRSQEDRSLTGGDTARSSKATPRPEATPRSGGQSAKTPRQLFKGLTRAFRKKPLGTKLVRDPGTLTPVTNPMTLARSPYQTPVHSPKREVCHPGNVPIFEPVQPRSPYRGVVADHSTRHHLGGLPEQPGHLNRNAAGTQHGWFQSGSNTTSAASTASRAPATSGFVERNAMGVEHGRIQGGSNATSAASAVSHAPRSPGGTKNMRMHVPGHSPPRGQSDLLVHVTAMDERGGGVPKINMPDEAGLDPAMINKADHGHMTFGRMQAGHQTTRSPLASPRGGGHTHKEAGEITLV